MADTEPRFSETMWFKLGGAEDSATAALLSRPATDEAELEERYVDSGLLTIEDERAYSLNAPPSRGLTNDETEFLDRYSDDDIARYMVTERVPGRRRIGLVVGIAVLAVSFAASALPASVVRSVAEVARADATAPMAGVAASERNPERVAAKPPAPAPQPVAKAPAPAVAPIAVEAAPVEAAPVEAAATLEARSQVRHSERVIAKRGKARRATKRERARRARAERARKAKSAERAKAKRARERKARARAKARAHAKARAKAKRAKAKRAKAKRAKAKRAKARKAKRDRERRKRRRQRRG